MNKADISREAILHISRELLCSEGWKAVNIRTVAASCQVSVGTIYNYFTSKSDLAAATVESVWQDIFHFSGSHEGTDSFTGCVQWMFECMKKGEERYPGFFRSHPVVFLEEGKSGGQKLMAQSWKHMQEGLYQILMNDKKVRRDAFNENLTPEQFVEIVFSLTVSALLRQNYDCSGIVELISRIIY